VHVELAVVKMHVVFVNVFNAETVHHQRAGGHRLVEVFLPMSVGARGVTPGDPVTSINVVDGVLHNQIAGPLYVLGTTPASPVPRREARACCGVAP
jgi:hypothetical protein